MRLLSLPTLVLAAATFAAGAADTAPLTHAQALTALRQAQPGTRLIGIARLAEIGTMADAERLVALLHDPEPPVRAIAAAALWQVWGRSGDAAIDKLYARGVAQMEAAALDQALATFDQIVRRKPGFAEGWNKRATLYFLLGESEKSLHDCDEVLKRNRHHFGALAGAGQIHLHLGHAELALAFFRRALAVNPDLEGPAQVVPVLEQLLHDKGGTTT